MRADHSAFQTRLVFSAPNERENKKGLKIIKLGVGPSVLLSTRLSKRTLKVFQVFGSLLNMKRAVIADYCGKNWDCQNRLCAGVSLPSSFVFIVHSWPQFDFGSHTWKFAPRFEPSLVVLLLCIHLIQLVLHLHCGLNANTNTTLILNKGTAFLESDGIALHFFDRLYITSISLSSWKVL